MSIKNLSQQLLTLSATPRETSTLVNKARLSLSLLQQGVLPSKPHISWYRDIQGFFWTLRGIHRIEQKRVMARIAEAKGVRSDPTLLDTVVGYQRGNWAFEWIEKAAEWQTRASRFHRNCAWLKASSCYSLASYPHLAGDRIAELAQHLAYKAYNEAADKLPFSTKELVTMVDGHPLRGILHLPRVGNPPFSTIFLCGSLDGLQIDYHRFFLRYLSPRGMAMFTLDLPSVGYSSRWKLSEETSLLHQQALLTLEQHPFVDPYHIAAVGVRFGVNLALRMAYLMPGHLRAVISVAGIVHHAISEIEHFQTLPKMWIDTFASRLRAEQDALSLLSAKMKHCSLKLQGLLNKKLHIPLMVIHFEKDRISPESETALLMTCSRKSHSLAIPEASTLIRLDETLVKICQWLETSLGF